MGRAGRWADKAGHEPPLSKMQWTFTEASPLGLTAGDVGLPGPHAPHLGSAARPASVSMVLGGPPVAASKVSDEEQICVHLLRP